jgi:hypothetical protein
MSCCSIHAIHVLLGRPWQFDKKAKYNGFGNRYTLEKDGKIYILVSLLPRQVYKDQLKINRVEEVEQEFMKNNSEDVRLSENKVSHKC